MKIGVLNTLKTHTNTSVWLVDFGRPKDTIISIHLTSSSTAPMSTHLTLGKISTWFRNMASRHNSLFRLQKGTNSFESQLDSNRVNWAIFLQKVWRLKCVRLNPPTRKAVSILYDIRLWMNIYQQLSLPKASIKGGNYSLYKSLAIHTSCGLATNPASLPQFTIHIIPSNPGCCHLLGGQAVQAAWDWLQIVKPTVDGSEIR